MTAYTDSLRIAKQATAENDKVWGSVANTQIDLLDVGIAGAVSVDLTAADVVLTTANGSTDQARNMTLLLIGTPAATRNLIVPKKQKVYTVHNASGQSVTVKTSTGTGVVVPDASRYTLFVDEATDTVFGLVLHTAAAVSQGPANLTSVVLTVGAATAGTSTPTYYIYQEGGQIVVGTLGYTVTVNSIAFFVNGALAGVNPTDLDSFPLYIMEAGALKPTICTIDDGGFIYAKADSTGWTAPSSRVVPPHFVTARAA